MAHLRVGELKLEVNLSAQSNGSIETRRQTSFADRTRSRLGLDMINYKRTSSLPSFLPSFLSYFFHYFNASFQHNHSSGLSSNRTISVSTAGTRIITTKLVLKSINLRSSRVEMLLFGVGFSSKFRSTFLFFARNFSSHSSKLEQRASVAR